MTVLDTLNTSPATTFSVFGSGGPSVFAAQHAGPEFTLGTRTQITEVGAFLNNYCGIFGNPPCSLPFIVEIRAAIGGVPDKDNVIASFALTDDGNPFVFSYESAQPSLILDPGTYFALFAPQGPDFGVLLGQASPNFSAGQAPLGIVDPGVSGTLGETSAFQAVRILGIEVNQPPNCSSPAASPNLLWPPTHQMVTSTVSGVTDPDGNAVTITINSVTQDEPINALGDAHTGPDAAWVTGHSDQVMLRAERAETRDGRVYAIAFTADDGNGGTCTGSVQVSVPHDMAHAAVDSGQTINSFGP